MKRLIVSELKHGKAKWLLEVSDSAVSFAIDNLYEAYDRYFDKKANLPKFHVKESHQSFRDRRKKNRRNIRVDFKKSTLTIPRIKKIPCRFHREFDGEIRQVHVSKTASGKYFASLLVETGEPLPIVPQIDAESTIGIDAGIHTYATLSDGEVFDNPPRNKKEYRRIKILERRMQKMTIGSRKYNILKRRRAALYEKDTNRRHDYIHKKTHYLAYEKEASAYSVETLCVKEMTKNERISKQVRYNYFQGFYRQLEYKCAWNGKRLLKIDRYAPSSKRCSVCGYVNPNVKWGMYKWVCPACGTQHDRDLNAAMNIKAISLG